jgi:hypothetical protein
MVIYLSASLTRQRDITLRQPVRLLASGRGRAEMLPARPLHGPVAPRILFADAHAWRPGPPSAAELSTLYAEATLI